MRKRLVHLITQRRVGGGAAEVPSVNRKGRKSVKESLSLTDPTVHHQISTDTRNKVNIADYLDENEGDPALEVLYYLFIFCLY